MCFHKASYLWDRFTCPLPRAQDCANGAFSLQFLFPRKGSMSFLSSCLLLNLAHSGLSLTCLACARVCAPCSGASRPQSPAVHGSSGHRRLPLFSDSHPLPFCLRPAPGQILRTCILPFPSVTYFVASTKSFSPSFSLLVSSNPKGTSPLQFC